MSEASSPGAKHVAREVSAGYGELLLVEIPAIDLLTSLGWSFKNLYTETFGELGSEGRESESQVILTRRLRAALVALNPDLPADFAAILKRVTGSLGVGKAGFALSLEDRHLMQDQPFRHAEGWKRIWESEAAHWEDAVTAPGIAEPLFRADVDTTFALYDQVFFDPARPFRGIRVGGRFAARHLPWYRDTGLPAEEEAFYRRAAEYSYYMGDRPAMQLRALFARQDAVV